mgnify:CR=1 FL=1
MGEILDKTAYKQTSEEHRLKPYRWPKGVSGNPKGRPKGRLSPKDAIRQMFEKNPNTFHDFLDKYITDPHNRQHVIEMLDGKPSQAVAMEVSLPDSLIDLIKHGITNEGGDNKISRKNKE